MQHLRFTQKNLGENDIIFCLLCKSRKQNTALLKNDVFITNFPKDNLTRVEIEKNPQQQSSNFKDLAGLTNSWAQNDKTFKHFFPIIRRLFNEKK